ncbi:MAG: hypothetical protein ACRC57_14950 [Sarcina sp.]
MKSKKFFTFLLISFLFFSFYKLSIIFKCISPTFALEHYSKNNNIYEVETLDSYELTFSSDDYLIYELSNKDYDLNRKFTIRLKKILNFWFLDELEENF